MADTNTTIDASGYFGTGYAYNSRGNKIVRTSDGTLHVVYTTSDSGPLYIKTSSNAGATWSSATQITGASSVNSGTTSKTLSNSPDRDFFLIMNKDETMSVILPTNGSFEIVIITKTSAQSWATASVESYAVAGGIQVNSATCGFDNWMYVGYLNGTNPIVRYYNGTNWSNSQNLGNNSSFLRLIAVDSNKNLHIASGTNYQRANWVTSSWDTGGSSVYVTQPQSIFALDFHYDMTLDTDGNLHVLYGSGSNTSINYRKGTVGATTTSWGSAVTSSGSGRNCSIISTTGSTLYSFVSDSGGNLYVQSADKSTGFSTNLFTGTNLGTSYYYDVMPLNLPVLFGGNSVRIDQTASGYCFVYSYWTNGPCGFFLKDGTTFDSIVQSVALSGNLAATAAFSTPKLNFPTVVTNDTVSVPLRTSVSLDGLSVTDADYPTITYSIETLPAYGDIIKDGVLLQVNGTFTQSDLNSDLVLYVSSENTLSPTDSFRIKATNNGSGAVLFTKEISIQNPLLALQLQGRLLRFFNL